MKFHPDKCQVLTITRKKEPIHIMIYTYSIEKTYTPKVKRTIETENATPTAMEAFAKKLQSSNITE